MRKIILGTESGFPNGRTWRFVYADHLFSDPGNPWKSPVREVLNFNNLKGPVSDADFIGIKLGDINGSAPAFRNRGVITNRSSDLQPALARLEVPERVFRAGEDLVIPFFLKDLEKMAGCQFALEADSRFLEITGIEYGLAQADQIHWDQVEGNLVFLSWNVSSPILKNSAVSALPLFSLKVRALQSGSLSGAMRLDPRRIPVEAYFREELDFSTHPLQLAYQTQGADRPLLFPPVPNPASAQTTIQWWLPGDAEVQLMLRDSWGRVCMEFSQNYPAGTHTRDIRRPDVPAPGLYILTLKAMGQVQSQKILFIE